MDGEKSIFSVEKLGKSPIRWFFGVFCGSSYPHIHTRAARCHLHLLLLLATLIRHTIRIRAELLCSQKSVWPLPLTRAFVHELLCYNRL